MTVTATSFRENFPEFEDTTRYPDSQVEFYIALAVAMLTDTNWVTAGLLDFGIQFFVAHNLSLEGQAQITSSTGGVPGGNVGAATAKSVDKVSINYDVNLGVDPKDGHYALTIYGRRFIMMARMIGMRALQLGIGPMIGPAAWAGPWPWLFPNMNQ